MTMDSEPSVDSSLGSSLGPKVPSPTEIVGLIAAAAPFTFSMASASYRTVNGQVTSFSYSDPVAIAGGAVAALCGIIGLTLLRRTDAAKKALRIGLCALLIGGGVFQILRGLGKVGVTMPMPTVAVTPSMPVAEPVAPSEPPPAPAPAPAAETTDDLVAATRAIIALWAANKIDEVVALAEAEASSTFDKHDLQFVRDTFVESFGPIGTPGTLTVEPAGDDFRVFGPLPFGTSTLDVKLVLRRTPQGVRWRGTTFDIPQDLQRKGDTEDADALAKKLVDLGLRGKFDQAMFHPRLIANTPADIDQQLAGILGEIGTIKYVGRATPRTCDEPYCVSFVVVGAKKRASFDVDLRYSAHVWRVTSWNLTYK